MLTCDWCHRPLGAADAKGWAYELEFIAFHPLALDGRAEKGPPCRVTLEIHVHADPCTARLSRAVLELLEAREPLETDGPSDEDEEAEVEESSEDEGTDRVPTIQELREARARWERLDKAERQRLALNALGDGRLFAREIFERVAAALPGVGIYRSDIDPLLKSLLEAREVDREREEWRGRMCWRYFARRELQGPIEDLERAYNDEED